MSRNYENLCAWCSEHPGLGLGPDWPEDEPVCENCYDEVVASGCALPADAGGMLHYADAEEHPFREGRYTVEPLELLFASTPEDKTTMGGPRVLARGKSGKMGVRAIIDATYLSKVAPLEPPEPWERVGVFALPGLYELAAKTKSNDTVLREALAVVEEHLSAGAWVLCVATPAQLAFDLYVFARPAEDAGEEA